MTKVDITGNAKRNPHREFPIEQEERKTKRKGAANDSDSDIDESQIPNDKNVLVAEHEIHQVVKKTRIHNDLIKSIQFINVTDRPLILTGSTDKLVHLVDFETA